MPGAPNKRHSHRDVNGELVFSPVHLRRTVFSFSEETGLLKG
ncbi:hypothetical protein HM1_0939 [Heliomicrobium modesticaldum Ice1]|uniref:Uncharacterized protein n=1 Tax=Heliobacterium modesticaldum (strain ATCC 51547 / Ice1) TaxID=498761 RepID=B0TA90_HELMI|nr:hypothetical protein HM1_0939 [Heliomicrobium modesticaldum Ice1]